MCTHVVYVLLPCVLRLPAPKVLENPSLVRGVEGSENSLCGTDGISQGGSPWPGGVGPAPGGDGSEQKEIPYPDHETP